MDVAPHRPAFERQLALLGYELVHLELVKEGRDSVLRLFVDHVDHERPVTLDDCVAVNEGLVPWLDVTFPELRETTNLEVSSPGLERPLVKPEHFRRFAGHLCRLQTRTPLQGQKRFKGWIGDVTDQAVTLEEDGVLKAIPFENIQKARLAPFDEPKTPKPKLVAQAGPRTAGAEDRTD